MALYEMTYFTKTHYDTRLNMELQALFELTDLESDLGSRWVLVSGGKTQQYVLWLHVSMYDALVLQRSHRKPWQQVSTQIQGKVLK